LITPQSDVPGIVWPALTTGTTAGRMLALQQQLSETQWLDPDALRRRQFLQLDQLLAHAYRESPFYRQRLQAAGYTPGFRVTEEFWAGIPLLTRGDIHGCGEALRSRRLPLHHDPAQMLRSSGTTGQPVTTYSSRISRLFWAAFTLRDHFWHNRDFSKVLAAIRFSDDRSAEDGIRYEQWDSAVARVTSSGPSFVLDIAYPIEHQATWLRGLNPDYLVTHPTKLEHLARYCLAHGIKLPRLRQVMTVSEVLESEPVEACRAAWGVGVTDVYSTKESSYLALQCPEEGRYHVQSEGVLLEVLDGDRPCGPGEVGRVVVTPLHNFAMPLIREELGDYAEVGEACPCGRGLPVLKRILGRVRNLATLPTGAQFFPRIPGAHRGAPGRAARDLAGRGRGIQRDPPGTARLSFRTHLHLPRRDPTWPRRQVRAIPFGDPRLIVTNLGPTCFRFHAHLARMSRTAHHRKCRLLTFTLGLTLLSCGRIAFT
jgi:phenylacetate-CoA ligase